MKSLQKKIAVFITCLSTCIVSSGISVFAQENKLDSTNTKITACPPPRTKGTMTDESFINFIENEYNISRNDDNVFVQFNGNGTTSVTIVESKTEFVVLTSPTKEEAEMLENYNENKKSILWEALVLLYRLVTTAGDVISGCELIQGVSGVDVCGEISKQVIDNLIAVGTKQRFKVIRDIVKKPCPFPPHSQQCNEPPYAYWRTSYQAY